MKPTHLLGIDLGASSLRIQWSTLAPDGSGYLPARGADFAEAQDGVMPLWLELDANRRRIVSYGRKAEYRLREEGGSPRMLSGLKAALEGQSAVCGREEAFRWCEALLQEVAASLAQRCNSPLTPQYGWAIYAGMPDRWNQETQSAYHQMLQRCFTGAQIDLVTEARAALYYHIDRNVLPAGDSELRALIINCGDGGADFVLGTVRTDGDRLHDARAYHDAYAQRLFDERIARFIAASCQLPTSDPAPADLVQNSKRFKEQFSEEIARGGDRCEMVGPLLIGGSAYPCSNIVLTRSDFESDAVAGKLIREFSRALDRALSALRVQPDEPDIVIPVGGGADWYFVPALLDRRFPQRRVQGTLAPHLAVAQGLPLTHTMRRAGLHPTQTAAQFSIRIQRRVFPLPVGGRLTRLDLSTLEPVGDDTTVAEVKAHATDPKVLGLKNLSGVTWILILSDGTRRSVDPGRLARLVPGSTIDFNGLMGEVESR